MHILNNPISRTTLLCGDFVADTILGTPDPDPSFVENVHYAQEAMDYTIEVLPMGASNKPNAQVSYLQINEMRDVVKRRMAILERKKSSERSSKMDRS